MKMLTAKNLEKHLKKANKHTECCLKDVTLDGLVRGSCGYVRNPQTGTIVSLYVLEKTGSYDRLPVGGICWYNIAKNLNDYTVEGKIDCNVEYLVENVVRLLSEYECEPY